VRAAIRVTAADGREFDADEEVKVTPMSSFPNRGTAAVPQLITYHPYFQAVNYQRRSSSIPRRPRL